jgi:hypothetical protein
MRRVPSWKLLAWWRIGGAARKLAATSIVIGSAPALIVRVQEETLVRAELHADAVGKRMRWRGAG